MANHQRTPLSRTLPLLAQRAALEEIEQTRLRASLSCDGSQWRNCHGGIRLHDFRSRTAVMPDADR